MTTEEAQERLNKAWGELVQRKANADAALADKRWDDADDEIMRLRWACSEVEHAIRLVRWAGKNLPPVESFAGILNPET